MVYHENFLGHLHKNQPFTNIRQASKWKIRKMKKRQEEGEDEFNGRQSDLATMITNNNIAI